MFKLFSSLSLSLSLVTRPVWDAYKTWKFKRHIKKFGSKNAGYFNYFNQEWFEEHQSTLIWLLNHWLLKYWFRWILRIQKDCNFSEYIDEIKPNTYRIKISENTFRSDFRTHQKFSKRIYYAFYPIWWLAHFFDWVLLDRQELIPSFGFLTLTKYPDADPETNTVDGYVDHQNSASTWSVLRSGAGGSRYVADNTGNDSFGIIFSFGASPLYTSISRSIFLFNTNAIGASSTITGAIFSFVGSIKYQELGAMTLNVVSSNPSSNTSLTGTDWATLGTTIFGSVTYADFINGWNDITLNANGLSNISKTGITKKGCRLANDISGTSPTWADSSSSGFFGYFADVAGTGTDPKLVVTYITRTLIDSYSESNWDAQRALCSTQNLRIGQSFTAGNNYNLTNCSFYLYKIGSPTGNIYATLYTHSGTYGTSSVGTGSALATSDAIDTTIVNLYSPSIVTFNFSTPYLLTNGTKYVIAVEYSGGNDSNIIYVRLDSSSPTHGGNYSQYVSSWTAVSSYDACFYVYGNVATSIKTINGIPIANIKTINGIPIANIKSINGLQ